MAPNAVNPIKDILLFATFFSNPVSVVMVVVMWLFFAALGVWSRRKDKADLALVNKLMLYVDNRIC